VRAGGHKTRPNRTKLAQVVHARLVNRITQFSNKWITGGDTKCVLAW
jgi:hypothetical protein